MTHTPVSTLADELAALIGHDRVSTSLGDRERASADWAKMSPILGAQLPLGLADVVATPSTAEQIGAVVAAAVRHGVPVTPRGKGTGNYGQGIPMRGGVVIDTTQANRVIGVGNGVITAEAGATLAQLEVAAHEHDQQVWMFPSTVNSSIGGFLAGGSGGTGTIVHGSITDGFVVSLDVVYADGTPTLHRIEGDDVDQYLHAFGTSGVIARATVRTEPHQPWCAMYSSFDTFVEALTLIRELARLEPHPRLVSADTPTVVNALPRNDGHPHDRASLRSILDERALPAATAIVESRGGRVEAVKHGHRACQKLSLLSYNHPTWHLQKAHPDTYFHLEVGGHALIDRFDEVDAVYEGSQLHIEAGHEHPIGMLNGFYESRDQVYDGIDALRALGVLVHSPHEWLVDRNVDAIRATASRTDPGGLLNPGKLV